MNKLPVYFLIIFLSGTFVLTAQYDSLINSYNLIHTIAGTGYNDTKGANNWLESFEGKQAETVELSRPHTALSDNAGNIYVTDKDAHAIRMINTEGEIVTVAGINAPDDGSDTLATKAGLNAPNGLWVMGDGSFYILDLNNNKVKKVNTEGNIRTVFTDSSGISLGRGLWVSPNEDSIFYSSGTELKMWTVETGVKIFADGFFQLGNIAGSPNGKLGVTDRGAHLVYSIDLSTAEKEIIAGNGTGFGGGDGYKATETGLYGVRAIWYLKDGSFLLGTHEGSQVWYVDLDNAIHLFVNGLEGDNIHSGDGDYFKSPGYKISEVRHVSVDVNDNILIVENDRGFIRKIEKGIPDYVENLSSSGNFLVKKIYPNPATDCINIETNFPGNYKSKIKIYDFSGRIQNISYQPPLILECLQINTSQLEPGIYLLEITSHGSTEKHKIIIQN